MIGTTVAPSNAIPEAFTAAFTAIGVELSDDQISAVRGKSKREAIAELLNLNLGTDKTQVLGEQVYNRFQARLRDHYKSGGALPIHGATDTFAWCNSVNAKVALTTGFDRNTADLLIDSLGWEQAVDAVVSNDEVLEGRPAPFLIHKAMESTGINAVDRVGNVGDTVSDLQSGANANVGWNFAVLTGAHDRSRLSGVDGAIILESVADLPEYRW